MLKYKGEDEDSLSQLKLSVLFNSYFNSSEGVPGVALNTWKSNVVFANSEEISIKKPISSKTEKISELPADWWVVIALFLQHKIINVAKLSRVTGFTTDESEKIINGLFNAGIIVAKSSNAFTLGRIIEPYLVDECLQKGII
jgi:hypothetical protein